MRSTTNQSAAASEILLQQRLSIPQDLQPPHNFLEPSVAVAPNSAEAQYSTLQADGRHTPPQAVSPPSSSSQGPTNLFVFHLPPYVFDEGLYQLFAPFGALQSVKVITDRITGESRGYGFVKYYHTQNAVLAIRAMNGYKIGNKYLKVNFKSDSSKSRA